MATPEEAYSKDDFAKMTSIKEEEDKFTDDNLKGKMSHKADGVDDLKKLNMCMPVMKNEWKAIGKSKVYMGKFAAHAESCPFAPFACTLQSGFVTVLDVKAMKIMQPIVKEPFVLETAISDYDDDIRGSRICVTGGMQNLINIYDMTKKDEQSGNVIKTGQFSDPLPALEGASHNGYIAALEFIDGGKKLLSGSGDATVKLWDAKSKQLIQTFKGHHKDITGIAVKSNGSNPPNIFATTSSDKSCRVWDMRVDSGKGGAVRKWQAKYSTNCCTFVGANEEAVAAGCDNACWEVWETGCNMQIGRGKVKKGRCESIGASKSGRFLYMGWDNPDAGYLMMADTYKPADMKKIEGPTDMVKGIAMDPHGAGMVTTSFDTKVMLWSGPN